MKYSVKVNESNLVLSANDSEIFFKELAKLPEGEYTVNVMSDASRSGKHGRKKATGRVSNTVGLVLEFIAVLLALGCIVPLWIICCALI